MKVFVYSCRPFDEEPLFKRFAEEFGMELGYTAEPPSEDNCSLASGSDFVSVLTTPITSGILDRFKESGVRMVCTRTIGYNHIDLEHARKIGMTVSHITYDAGGVAEYTVMMMIAAARRLKEIQKNNAIDDFRLNGLMGRRMCDLTVGIIGAGAIGRKVIRILSGFGCRILYWNRSDVRIPGACKVSFGELISESDMISLHLEYNTETRHIINRDTVSAMKDGVIIVNTARGPLIDTEALIEGIESGKIAGASLDVIEDEFGYYYNDCRGKVPQDSIMNRLRSCPGIFLTHHMAFYYDRAVEDMVRNSFIAMKALGDGEEVPLRLA